MKKISTLFLIVLCICVAAVFVSCGEHTHAWDEGTVTIEPTCMYSGEIVYKCECGKTKTATLDKLDHEYESELSFDNAFHFYACSGEKCTSINRLTKHEWGSGKLVTAPTCKEKGTMKYTCSCGATKTESVAKTEHVFDEGTITTVATCQTKAIKTYKCVCGESYTEELEKLGDHSFDTEWTVTEETHYHACTIPGCEEIKDEKAHDWGKGEITVKPNCMEKGEIVYTCICGETKTEEIAEDPHEFSDKLLYNDKYHYHFCMNKGCTATDELIEHEWSEPEISFSDDKTMIETFKCDCGKVKTVVHVYGRWNKAEEGHYRNCTMPEHDDVHTVPHDWDDGKIDPYNPNNMLYTCTTCGYKESHPIVIEDPSADPAVVNRAQWQLAFEAAEYESFTAEALTYDEDLAEWVAADVDAALVEGNFANLTSVASDFFSFAFATDTESYKPIDKTVGDVEYEDVSYSFNDGELVSIEAVIKIGASLVKLVFN